jgi:hypothetical protein
MGILNLKSWIEWTILCSSPLLLSVFMGAGERAAWTFEKMIFYKDTVTILIVYSFEYGYCVTPALS